MGNSCSTIDSEDASTSPLTLSAEISRVTMLSVFDFQSQSVRVLIINDEPWFVAKDIFQVLSMAWAGSQSLDKIKDDWKMSQPLVDSLGRTQEVVVINESAVYKIAFRSNKTEAENFTDFVASEILPTIRKTGKYESEQIPQFDIPKTYADALMLAANQAKTIEQLETQKAQDAPLVAFAEKVAVAVNQISIADMAKILGTGQNKLFAKLRQLKVIQYGKVIPYQKYVDSGWFVVTEFTKQCNTGVRAFPTTRVTGKGQIKIAELLGKAAKGDGIVHIDKIA